MNGKLSNLRIVVNVLLLGLMIYVWTHLDTTKRYVAHLRGLPVSDDTTPDTASPGSSAAASDTDTSAQTAVRAYFKKADAAQLHHRLPPVVRFLGVVRSNEHHPALSH